MFFFSKSGFTEKAKELCEKEGVKMLTLELGWDNFCIFI